MKREKPAPPVRMAHLGLGNFFRAHQAWYTALAPDASEWGYAAFTGRSSGLADRLAAQDGLYELIERGPADDRISVIGSVVAAHPGTDGAAWERVMARPELAVVTLTVTEAAYADVVPERLLAGLRARRAAGAGALAVVSCDNLPENGPVTARAVLSRADPQLAGWIRATISFPTTMVDRITPATAPEEPVITEPFSEWVLAGDFPAGRPAWEEAGARFVADVAPHERRKLWLLNGGHSLLAYAGSARGHETIAQAVADPVCRAWLDEWWDEAAPRLPLPAADVVAYRAALLERWANPRIRHRLAQIAADGSQKLPVRILPVLRLARADGRLPSGAIRVIAAWIRHLRGAGAPVDDAGAERFRGSPRDVLAGLDPRLGDDRELVAALEQAVSDL